MTKKNFAVIEAILSMTLAQRLNPNVRNRFGEAVFDEMESAHRQLRSFVHTRLFGVDLEGGEVENTAFAIEEAGLVYLLDQFDGREVPSGCGLPGSGSHDILEYFKRVDRKRNISARARESLTVAKVAKTVQGNQRPMLILARASSLDSLDEDETILPMSVGDEQVLAVDSIHKFLGLPDETKAVFICLHLLPVPVDISNFSRQIDRMCSSAQIVSFAAQALRVLSSRSPREEEGQLTKIEISRVLGMSSKQLRAVIHRLMASEIDPLPVFAWLEAAAEKQRSAA